MLREPPKEGIKLEDIEEISRPNEAKDKKNLLSIKFPTKAKIIFPKSRNKDEVNPILGRSIANFLHSKIFLSASLLSDPFFILIPN